VPLCIVLQELRFEGRVHAEHILQDQNLAVRVRTGADPDGGDADGLSDLTGQSRGHAFEHQRKAASILQAPAGIDERPSVGFGLALILFAGTREKILLARVPRPMQDTAIGLVTAGVLSLAFFAFKGWV